MSPGFRFIAPAGAPITARDLWRTVALALGQAPAEVLTAAVAGRFNMNYSVAAATGRAAMTILFQALSRLAPHRTEVVLPAYTCYSVAASTMKAGLTPRLVDVTPGTLDYSDDSLARTDFSKVLAIVATNLYGLPNDMPRLERLARNQGVFLVDDAAQSMGARVMARPSGTWGDAGLFSFDKGKPVTAIDGGLIGTNSVQVAASLRMVASRLSPPGPTAAAVHGLKALAYAVLLKPRMYWLPERIPMLGLGHTTYSTDFPIQLPDRLQAALGAVTLAHLDDYTRARVSNAALLRRSLEGLKGVLPVEAAPGTEPSYLRLPVLVDDPRSRDVALSALRAAGIGATGSYPASLVDVPALSAVMRDQQREATGGRHVAARILTLPTHPLVTPSDIARMTRVLAGTLGETAPRGAPTVTGGPRPKTICAE